MSDINKAHLMVKVYFLKLLTIIDFSDFVFKEVQSLFSDIKTFLNQDVRLECNKVKPERHVDLIKDEIMVTTTKYDFYVNTQPDTFQSNKNCFKFLGLLTEKDSDNLRLRGKVLFLKSRSKGSIDIVCHNTKEFQSYISQGTFQRQHVSSIMT